MAPTVDAGDPAAPLFRIKQHRIRDVGWIADARHERLRQWLRHAPDQGQELIHMVAASCQGGPPTFKACARPRLEQFAAIQQVSGLRFHPKHGQDLIVGSVPSQIPAGAGALAQVVKPGPPEGRPSIWMVVEGRGTERTQALQRVLAQVADDELRYRSLFFDARVSMLMVDPADGRIVEANAAAGAFYGYEAGRMSRMSV